MRNRVGSRGLGLFVCWAMILTGCTGSTETTTSTTIGTSTSTTLGTSTTTQGPTSTTAPVDLTSTTSPVVVPPPSVEGLRSVAPFASGFPENPLLIDEPPYRGPATPTIVDDVLWLDEAAFVIEAHPGMLDALSTNGFAILDGGFTQFHQAYGSVDSYRRQPLFVTTDAAYHYWHLVFAKALKDTEQSVLLPVLEDFSERLLELATSQEVDLAASEIAANAIAVRAYGQVLTALTDLPTGPYPASVTEELTLVRDHLESRLSPASGAFVDYTLFRPRGHYTENADLTRYFVAMSALGGAAFRLDDSDQLLTAVLLSKLITTDQQLSGMWRDLFEPTAFLVGFSDDYSPFEVADAVTIADVDWDDPAQLDRAGLLRIKEELLAMRDVAIDAERASVRVMGTRFVLDSFILDQLVDPNVSGRLMGTPLDVASAFGSEWALRQLDSSGVTEDPNYSGQMTAMADIVAGRAPGDWAGTVYDAWLYAIQPSWIHHGSAYPDLMQTDAWSAKAHQSGFGSYTELKHDTVLYAKQGYAEGEGPPPPPAEPRHWVEPEPVVYARLAAVAALMRDGLASRGLLTEDVADLLDLVIPMYERFERLATDELAGRSISQDDNLWLESIGARFELLWLLANEDDTSAAGQSGFSEAPYDMSGLIVDIMSNPELALEIGTGLVSPIYVLVPNDSGVFQLARGGVYSYYEFTVPRGERMTDEEWRKLFVNEWGGRPEGSEGPPERPEWIQTYVVETG